MTIEREKQQMEKQKDKERKAFNSFKKKYFKFLNTGAMSMVGHDWIIRNWIDAIEASLNPISEKCECVHKKKKIEEYFYKVDHGDLSEALLNIRDTLEIIQKNFSIFYTIENILLLKKFVEDWKSDMESNDKKEITVLFPGFYPQEVIEEYHRMIDSE